MRDTELPLPAVKNQYESLPYPARDPALEKQRLVQTWLDDLPMINHYCFAGRQSFRQGFRVLVAGGGTGDATLYLAEQLKHHDAQIVHLDMSAASTAIARERARMRGLDNIEWIEDSLLSLPALALAPFDYINCSGVPFYFHEPLDGETLARLFASNRGQPFALRHQHSGVVVTVNPGRYSPQILRLIDGRRSFGEIFDQFRRDWHGKAQAPDNAVLFADFAESYDTLNAIDRLLLRHPLADAPT